MEKLNILTKENSYYEFIWKWWPKCFGLWNIQFQTLLVVIMILIKYQQNHLNFIARPFYQTTFLHISILYSTIKI